MDLLTFISQLIDSVVWPLVAIFFVLQFKKPISELLLKLSRIKHKDTVLDFGKKMDELKEEAKAEGLADNSNKPQSISRKEKTLFTVASIAPSTAILQAWSEVEEAVVKLIQSKGIEIKSVGAAPYKALQELMLNNKLLENKKIKIYADLRRLRNKVAHAADYDVNEEQASEYINIAMNLVDVVEKA